MQGALVLLVHVLAEKVRVGVDQPAPVSIALVPLNAIAKII